VDKSEGKWIELDANSDRIVNQDYGAKLDAERQRKRDVIGGRKINPRMFNIVVSLANALSPSTEKPRCSKVVVGRLRQKVMVKRRVITCHPCIARLGGFPGVMPLEFLKAHSKIQT
jgi:hypothetical protein